MLDVSGLNYLAIAVAWLITIGVGSFWYSPSGFGKRWSKLSGVDIMKLPKDEANRSIMLVVVSSLLQVFGLAVTLKSFGTVSFTDAVVTGLFLWFFFTAITTIGTTFYQRKGWSFWWLNSSFFLVVMSINSVLLTIWR
jgi:hypothetical protein